LALCAVLSLSLSSAHSAFSYPLLVKVFKAPLPILLHHHYYQDREQWRHAGLPTSAETWQPEKETLAAHNAASRYASHMSTPLFLTFSLSDIVEGHCPTMIFVYDGGSVGRDEGIFSALSLQLGDKKRHCSGIYDRSCS
jgi:hypothetical protein